MVAQPFCEFASVLALSTFVAAHVQGFTNQEQPDTQCRGDAPQVLEIFADTIPREGFDALRGEAKFVANREADALFAHIEGEDAGGVRRFGGIGKHLIKRIEESPLPFRSLCDSEPVPPVPVPLIFKPPCLNKSL